MKVAVSGAAGFIGRHVLEELARHSVDVVAIVHSAKQAGAIKSPVRSIVMDIADPPQDSYTAIGRPDVLIHLAWGGLPNYKSLHHFESELPCQYNFLAGLVKGGLPDLIVTGTCFEYGMKSGSLSETCETQPCNPYGYAKDALRRQLDFLHASFPFAFTWARLFYTYGNGQSGTSLLSQLKEAVERGDAIFNMSGGEQLRDFLPVGEIAVVLVLVALRREDVGILNICSGKPVSIRALVESQIEEHGWKIKPNFGCLPYPDYEPMAFWGDRVKLDRLLGEP